MPRSADALPMTMIFPARRASICGSTARHSRGSGCTRWSNTDDHSASVTSAAAVDGAGQARFATSTSTCPQPSTRLAGRAGSSSGPESAITSAPCAAERRAQRRPHEIPGLGDQHPPALQAFRQ